MVIWHLSKDTFQKDFTEAVHLPWTPRYDKLSHFVPAQIRDTTTVTFSALEKSFIWEKKCKSKGKSLIAVQRLTNFKKQQ